MEQLHPSSKARRFYKFVTFEFFDLPRSLPDKANPLWTGKPAQ